jgi:hypothetical protein
MVSVLSPSLLLGLPVLPFEARGSRSRSKGGTLRPSLSSWYIRYLVYLFYGVSLCPISIFSIFIPHNFLLEWERKTPTRTRFFWGQF